MGAGISRSFKWRQLGPEKLSTAQGQGVMSCTGAQAAGVRQPDGGTSRTVLDNIPRDPDSTFPALPTRVLCHLLLQRGQ